MKKINKQNKIGIITICDYTNYGNRLQNYAVQELINSLGYKVHTIRNITPVPNWDSRIKKITIKNIVIKIKNKIESMIKRMLGYNKIMDKKRGRFLKFTDTYISQSKFVLEGGFENQFVQDEYKFFLVGSDQVWNPQFRNGFEVDFLTFAPIEKRISFSASFGISEIPDEYKERYTKWLSEMAHLSVREEAGAKIIKDLTGRDAEVLADPTLILTREKWLSIAKEHVNKPKEEYLLTYFLGDISKETKQAINKISTEHNLKIVNLANFKDKEFYAADPSEFIDYINSSKIFLTDSFHGVVFSIILRKAFIVFEREGNGLSMNSRIETLFNKFDLHDRSWKKVKEHGELFEVNYDGIDEKLEYEREKALNYLKNALNK